MYGHTHTRVVHLLYIEQGSQDPRPRFRIRPLVMRGIQYSTRTHIEYSRVELDSCTLHVASLRFLLFVAISIWQYVCMGAGHGQPAPANAAALRA